MKAANAPASTTVNVASKIATAVHGDANAFIAGPSGKIEVLVEGALPENAKGLAVLAHPHPQFGGTLHNKVVQTLARAFVQAGWRVVRFNFRGVLGSEGVFDDGRGETQDLSAVVDHFSAQFVHGGPRLALAGFSFGTFTICHLLELRPELRPKIAQLVLVGCATERFVFPPIAPELHPVTHIVHAEKDEVIALSSLLDWLRPQSLPCVVFPGGSHFFHGQLTQLKEWIVRCIA